MRRPDRRSTIHARRALPPARDARPSSASASRTPPASGTPTTSPACSRCSLRNAERGARAASVLAPLAASAPAPQPAQRACSRARREHPVPLRPRQRPLRAVPRRVDDLLVRASSSATDEPLARGAAGEVPARSASSSSSARTTTCSRSAAAGAASRSWRPASTARASPGSRSRRSRRELARERVAAAGLADRVEIRRAGLPRASRAVHEDRLDRDARGDRRAAVRRPSSRRSTACSRPAASPASRRSCMPDQRFERYRASARLDPALHLPGLADPVARGAARRR